MERRAGAIERRPGRPRGLTVDAIARAALDDGITVFSMPSVARRLGVAHSGLYRYVADRDDLLVQAIDLAFAEVSWPDADLPWDELLREIGESFWRACDAYPGLDSATQLAAKPAPGVLAKMDDWVASLHAQNFLIEDAAVGVEFVGALSLDASTQMRRLRKMEQAHPDRRNIPVLKAYDNAEVWEGRGLYARKLEIFLSGLATRRLSDDA